LSDVGKVYQGSYKEPIGRDWAFGQFEDSVLPAAVYLLDRSTLRPSERGSPVKVARAISAMVNQVDDGGVLVGRWSGDYEDGVAPWMWTGKIFGTFLISVNFLRVHLYALQVVPKSWSNTWKRGQP